MFGTTALSSICMYVCMYVCMCGQVFIGFIIIMNMSCIYICMSCRRCGDVACIDDDITTFFLGGES